MEGQSKSKVAEGVWTFDEISLLKAKWLADLEASPPPPAAHNLVDEGGERRHEGLLQEIAPIVDQLGLAGEEGATTRLGLLLLAFIISVCCTGGCIICMYQFCRPKDRYPHPMEHYPMHYMQSAQGYVVSGVPMHCAVHGPHVVMPEPENNELNDGTTIL